MSHHMKDWSEMGGKECSGGMGMFQIPIPMAMFGMCVAFMFGAMIGMLMGKKRMMAGGMGMHGGMMGHGRHGMMWRKGRHHHHGSGMPACGCEDLVEMKSDEDPAES